MLTKFFPLGLFSHRSGAHRAVVKSEKIEQAINGLNREGMDGFKRNALMAARELNWDSEFQKQRQSYEALVGSRPISE